MQHHRPLAKRSACDRCREHKLRCLRSPPNSQGTCIRCTRASAECVTGAARPLGRSRVYTVDEQPSSQQQQQQQQQHRVPKRSRHSVFLSVGVQPHAPRGRLSSSAIGSSSTTANTTSATQDGELNPLTSTPFHDDSPHSGLMPSTPFDEHLPIDTDLSNMFLFDDSTSALHTPEDTESIKDIIMDLPLPYDDNNSLFALSSLHHQPQASLSKLVPSISSPPSTLGFLFDTPYSPHPWDVTNRPISSTNSSSSASPLILSRLARLNDSIAHQVSRMDSFVIGKPPPDLVTTCVEKISDSQVNPLLSTLESTTDLASIIKQAISISHNHSPQTFSALTTPVLLMTLSAHMQLLQIYEVMFFQVHKFLGGMRDQLTEFFGNIPDFTHVAGLPPVKGDLYIKIVIQIIQHNISSVERAIGLPFDLCLSPHQMSVPPRSLLGSMDTPGAVQAVMDQVCHPSEKSGRDLVASLREKMGDVLSILRHVG